MTTLSHLLALAALRPGDIPAAARQMARFSLYDWMVCGLAGVEEPLAQILRDMVGAEGGHPVASLFGGGAVPARAAALVNGATSHALDYDDVCMLATCHPILACFAENIVHAGPVGAGHQMKLLHNYVSLGSVALLSEAAACARRAGVSGETFVQVLSVGGGWGAALDRIKPFVTSGDSSNLRFSVSNALKDLTYYNQMATDTQAHHDIAQAVQHTLDWACKAGDPNAFLPELIGYLAEKS